jgi:Rrf2 family protein
MFKLNRKLEYALMALKHMLQKRPGELTSAKEIADLYGCSFDTISRVLQILAQKGCLQSVQGAAGGYILIKDLAHFSFYDLSKMLLGPIQLVRCLSSSCHIKKQCNIASPLQNLNSYLIEFYKELSVLQILTEEPVTKKRGTDVSLRKPNSTSAKTTPTPIISSSLSHPPLLEEKERTTQ